MTPLMSEKTRTVGIGLALVAFTAGLAPAALTSRAVPVRPTAARGAAPLPRGVRGMTRQAGMDGQVVMARGARVFRESCARCHGAAGEGRRSGCRCCGATAVPLAGSALTRWQVRAAVRQGIPPRMPAFGGRLSEAEIKAVAVYVQRLGAGPPAGEDRAWPPRRRPSVERLSEGSRPDVRRWNEPFSLHLPGRLSSTIGKRDDHVAP